MYTNYLPFQHSLPSNAYWHYLCGRREDPFDNIQTDFQKAIINLVQFHYNFKSSKTLAITGIA